MKPVTPLQLQTARGMDKWTLWIILGMFAINIGLGFVPGITNDLVRLYAISALILELGCIYIPASTFIERRGGRKAFGFTRISGWECAWAVLFGVGVFFLSTAVNGLAQFLWQLLGANPDMMPTTPLPTEGGWRLIATIFLVAVIPAFAEETLFRGAMLHAWLPRGKKRALVYTAALFALVHFQPAALPAYLLLSFALGYVALATGSVFPAMIVHGVNNLFGILITYLAGDAAVSEAAQATLTAEMLPVLLVYAALGVGACLGGYRGMKTASDMRAAPQPDAADTEAAAQQDTPEEAAPVKNSKISAPLIVIFAILGIVNLFVLISMFLELPQGMPL